MKVKIPLSLIFIFSCCSLIAQTMFQKTYGGTTDDQAWAVEQSNDDGFIMTGRKNTNSGGQDLGFIIKTNAFGDTLWTKTLTDFFGQSVIQCNDGNYIVAGSLKTSNGKSDVCLIKFNGNGDTLWVKSYGSFDVGEVPYFVNHTSEGGFIITGIVSIGGLRDVYLIKTDSTGNLLWANTYGSWNMDDGMSVSQTSDNGFIVVGFTQSYNSVGGDIYIIKTSNLGDTIWTKVYYSPGNSSDKAYSVEQTLDGGFVISGYTQGFNAGYFSTFLMKTNSNGNIQWAKNYLNNTHLQGRNAKKTADGGYIISAYGPNGSDVSNTTLIKTDSLGNVQWSKTYGGINVEVGVGVTTTSDEGYALINWTKSFGSGGYDFYLIKTDVLGNSGCNDTNTGIFVNNISFLEAGFQCQVSSNGIIGYPNIALANGCNVSEICSSCLTYGTDDISSCGSFTWIDGNTYTVNNNNATHLLQTASGCDSLVSLNLTILNSNSGSDTVTACDSYLWSADGNIYNSTGSYSTILSNVAGCDSLVTLNLTITNSNTNSVTVTACDNYFWPVNGNTYNSTGSYSSILTNDAGCDSIVILNLTITNSNTSLEAVTACNNYKWPTNGTTYNTTGSYSTTLTNAAGCDSIVTLELIIYTIDSSVTQSGIFLTAVQVGANYQWLDCDNNYILIPGETSQSFTPSENGNYAVEITQNGCIDTSACFLITSLGIIENGFGDNFLVFPNPTVNDFSIDLGTVYPLANVLIYNVYGEILHLESFIQKQVLNLSLKETAGIFLITVIADDKKAVLRVMKK